MFGFQLVSSAAMHLVGIFIYKCKLVLWGRNLGDVTTFKIEMTSLLKGLQEAEFQGCFQQWKQRWDKCIVSNGVYFEGDHIDVS